MCRFVFYLGAPITLGALVTEPSHSIIRQSYQSREREEPLNGDGFGLGWYVPEVTDEPAVFRDVSPAWSNVNLRNLARVTRSPCVLAHVRAATPGLPVTLLNCHPFAWGRFLFMHNGHLAGFPRYVRRLRDRLTDEAYLGIRGSTDSEHVFALFADAWTAREDPDPLDRMAGALADAIDTAETLRRDAGVEEPSFLNLVVTDGRRAVVARFVSAPERTPNTLYASVGREYRCDDGLCHMVPAEEGAHSVIVASEPLSTDGSWKPVPANAFLLITEGLETSTREIGGMATSAR